MLDQQPTITVHESADFHVRYLTRLDTALQDRCEQASIVLLPREGHPSVKEPFFPHGSLELLALLQERPQLAETILGVQDDDYVELSQHAGDVFFPILWVGSHVLFPATLNVMSSYIFERLKYALPRSKPGVDAHFKIRRSRGAVSVDIQYRGPASSFESLVKAAFDKEFPDA